MTLAHICNISQHMLYVWFGLSGGLFCLLLANVFHVQSFEHIKLTLYINRWYIPFILLTNMILYMSDLHTDDTVSSCYRIFWFLSRGSKCLQHLVNNCWSPVNNKSSRNNLFVLNMSYTAGSEALSPYMISLLFSSDTISMYRGVYSCHHQTMPH